MDTTITIPMLMSVAGIETFGRGVLLFPRVRAVLRHHGMVDGVVDGPTVCYAGIDVGAEDVTALCNCRSSAELVCEHVVAVCLAALRDTPEGRAELRGVFGPDGRLEPLPSTIAGALRPAPANAWTRPDPSAPPEPPPLPGTLPKELDVPLVDSGGAPVPELDRIIQRFVDGAGHDELASAARALAMAWPGGVKLLGRMAVLSDADDAHLARVVRADLRTGLSFGTPRIDTRQALDVAQAVLPTFALMEHFVDQGRVEPVREPARRAVERLARLTTRTEIPGLLAGLCERALALYAGACAHSAEDAAQFGRWLARFRLGAPECLDVDLDEFAPVLDQDDWAGYRESVQRAAENELERAGTRSARHAARRRALRGPETATRNLQRMRCELAERDGDLDLAVQILCGMVHEPDGRPCLVAAYDKLAHAGRHDQAMAMLDRVVAKHLTSADGERGPSSMPIAEVVAAYAHAGREIDGLDAARSLFACSPGGGEFRELLRAAERLDRRAEVRRWAVEHVLAHTAASQRGDALVRLHLGEGDLDGAWAVLATHAIRAASADLAAASVERRPADAARIFAESARALLERGPAQADADDDVGADAARMLARAGCLWERAGRGRQFRTLMTGLRARYAGRPAVGRAFDERRLP